MLTYAEIACGRFRLGDVSGNARNHGKGRDGFRSVAEYS